MCDFELLVKYNLTLSQYLTKVSIYNIQYIQYRDKINSLDIQKNNILFLKQHTNIPIIINDNLDLLKYSDGLHIGQEDLIKLLEKFHISNKDLLFKLLKKQYPSKIFGLSTHNEYEILEANNLDINYIGLGAYRNTTTKNISNILGDKVSYLAKISKHPVGAIGGVKLSDNIKYISYNVIGSALLNNEN